MLNEDIMKVVTHHLGDPMTIKLYKDYSDKGLSDKEINKMLDSANSFDYFYDLISEWYFDTENEVISYTINDIEEELRNNNIEFADEEIIDYISNNVVVELPYNDYFRQEVCVDLLIDTGDGNYDYTCNCFYPHYNGRTDETIDNEASLMWLAKQQGHSKTELKNTCYYDDDNGAFLKSVKQEVLNCSSHMNALVVLVKMTLGDLIQLKERIKNVQSKDFDEYYPKKCKNREYITLDKTVTIGLIDFWQGAGSLLRIELEKDLKLPLKYIGDIFLDGDCRRGYGVREIYGCDDSEWQSGMVK